MLEEGEIMKYISHFKIESNLISNWTYLRDHSERQMQVDRLYLEKALRDDHQILLKAILDALDVPDSLTLNERISYYQLFYKDDLNE